MKIKNVLTYVLVLALLFTVVPMAIGWPVYEGDKTTVGDRTITGDLTVTGSLNTTGTLNSLTSKTDITLVASIGVGVEGNFVQGNYLYLAGGDALKIYDISDPSNPELISSTATSGSGPRQIFVQGRYAYVVTKAGQTFEIFDVLDLSSPVRKSSTAMGEEVKDVHVQGGFAYVSADEFVKVYDITYPVSPLLVATISLAGKNLIAVDIQGSYLYIINAGATGGERDDTLWIYDITNPLSPSLSGSVAITTSAYDLDVQGRYAYVIDWGWERLTIIDISDPSTPVRDSETVVGGSPEGVVVSGKYAYVAKETADEIAVYDITDSTSPTLITTFSTTATRPVYLSIKGRYLFVSCRIGNALEIYDIGGTYIQQLEAGSLETYNADIRNDLMVGGSAQVRGALSVSQGIITEGKISASSLHFIGQDPITLMTDPINTIHYKFGSTGGLFKIVETDLHGAGDIGAKQFLKVFPGDTGRMIINSSSVDFDFCINGDTVANVFCVDAGTDTVVITGDMAFTHATSTGDFIWSGAGSGLQYASIYTDDNATTTVLAQQDTWYQITIFDANGPENGADGDHTSDDITTSKTGDYMVNVSLDIQSSASNAYYLSVFKNNGGTEIHQLEGKRQTTVAGKPGSVSLSGIVRFDATDTVEVWVKRTDGGGSSKNITIEHINLSLFQIGG